MSHNPNHSPNFSVDLDKVQVIIPVLNEEATIGLVVKTLQSVGLSHIRVVDNGSSDRSQEQARDAGAEVLSEPLTGYGQACWRGMKELTSDIEWILFCDGDGSDDLEALSNFWQYCADYDFILGNRLQFSGNSLTPVQRFGNRLAGTLIDWGWGQTYHDLGPLRLIRRQALEKLAMEDRGFGWTVEMQVKAVEANLKTLEIPVYYFSRKGGKSKISGTIKGSFQAGKIILSTLCRLYSRRHARWLEFLSAFFCVLGVVLLEPVKTVPHLWRAISVMGLGFILSGSLTKISPLLFWAVTLFSRFWLLGMEPGNDIWRYLWEGYIQNLGFNPYELSPDASILMPYREDWWIQINHRDHAAIYPPITQLIFRILAGLNPQVAIFKGSIIAADLGVCYLLTRRFGYQKTLLYAWNPLIIHGFAGEGHYDSWFMLALVLAWLCYESSFLPSLWSKIGSAVLVGFSIAIKWISLPILTFICWQEVKQRKLGFAVLLLGIGLMPLLLASIPYCSADFCSVIPLNTKFVQYGRSAELIPYLLDLIGLDGTSNNQIYGLILLVITIILLIKIKDFYLYTFSYLLTFLMVSPVIHAWYFTWFIPFGIRQHRIGIRLISLSAFVYFILSYRTTKGDFSWNLTLIERSLLWLPLLLGLIVDQKIGKSQNNT